MDHLYHFPGRIFNVLFSFVSLSLSHLLRLVMLNVRATIKCTQVVDEKPMVVCGAPSGGSNGLAVKPLSPEQEELINRLVYFQEEFDQPSEEDLRKISVCLFIHLF